MTGRGSCEAVAERGRRESGVPAKRRRRKKRDGYAGALLALLDQHNTYADDHKEVEDAEGGD